MKSFNLFRNTLKSKHKINNFSSILKNKDQTGTSDKSYSGTDTKHTMGSDRVLADDHQKFMTIIDDTKLHQQKNVPSTEMDKSENQNKTTEQENKQQQSQKKIDDIK
jgi:hypothetical protein